MIAQLALLAAQLVFLRERWSNAANDVERAAIAVEIAALLDTMRTAARQIPSQVTAADVMRELETSARNRAD